MKGSHECYSCGYTFSWDTEAIVPEVTVDVYAVGNDNGKVQYEIVGKCPNCQVMNKWSE